MISSKIGIRKVLAIIGKGLVHMGHHLVKRGVKVKYKVISSDQLDKKYTSNIWCLDGKYWVTDIDTYKKIIFLDWTNEKRYLRDRYDCDDFAWHFKAMMSRIYGLNGVGWAVGKVYEGDREVGYHAFNIIYTEDGSYLFEPQTDEISDTNRIGKWRYVVDWVIV